MHTGCSFTDPAVDVDIGLRGKCGMQAADRADFGDIPGLCERGFLPDHRFIVEIAAFFTGFFGKTAETAGIDADVCYVDILIADIGYSVTSDLFPFFVSGGCDLPDVAVPGCKKAYCILFTDPVPGCRIRENC